MEPDKHNLEIILLELKVVNDMLHHWIDAIKRQLNYCATLWPTHHLWTLNDVIRVTKWVKSEYKWESPNLHEMPTSAIWLVTLQTFDLFICELEQFSSSSCVVLTPGSVFLLWIKCLLARNIFNCCLQIALEYKVYHLKYFCCFFSLQDAVEIRNCGIDAIPYVNEIYREIRRW